MTTTKTTTKTTINKPLSETHPTMWSKRNGVTAFDLGQTALIQVSTVDVVEYERSRSSWLEEIEMQSKLIFDINKMLFEKQEELEKLQQTLYEERKEHERIVAEEYFRGFSNGTIAKDREAYLIAVEEGERITLRRVKEAIEEERSCYEADLIAGDSDVAVGANYALNKVLKELGLDGKLDCDVDGCTGQCLDDEVKEE